LLATSAHLHLMFFVESSLATVKKLKGDRPVKTKRQRTNRIDSGDRRGPFSNKSLTDVNCSSNFQLQ
jgi:hypothetical protein